MGAIEARVMERVQGELREWERRVGGGRGGAGGAGRVSGGRDMGRAGSGGGCMGGEGTGGGRDEWEGGADRAHVSEMIATMRTLVAKAEKAAEDSRKRLETAETKIDWQAAQIRALEEKCAALQERLEVPHHATWDAVLGR